MWQKEKESLSKRGGFLIKPMRAATSGTAIMEAMGQNF